MDSAVRDEWFGFVEELLLHRTQRRRLRQTPFAAADSGSKESLVSIQAQTLSCVRWARKDIAMLVRPEDMGPVISLIAPTGSPPFRSWSISAIPVLATSRMVRAAGVRTEG